MNTQRIFFPVTHTYVVVAELNNGTFVATHEDLSSGWVPGHGPTILSAIADLAERNIGLED